jgi:hypothetical protein
MKQLSKKNHVIKTTEGLKMFLLEKKNITSTTIRFIASVTEVTAATAFVHRAVSDAFRYHAALMHFSGILTERRHRKNPQTDDSTS